MVVSGSVKGHRLCRFYDMGWYYVSRDEKWGSSKGVRGLMLDGMCGVMREDNLGRGFTEIGYVPKFRVILKKNR